MRLPGEFQEPSHRLRPARCRPATMPVSGAALILFAMGAATLIGQESDFEKARTLYQDQHYAEAQPIFERITSADPRNATAFYFLGALALRRNELPEAVRRLEMATRLDPASALYQAELGDAYGASALQAGWISSVSLARKSQSAYQRAVKLEPANITHRLRLMNFYVHAPRLAGGGIEKAYDVAEAIRSRDPLQGGLAIITLHLGQKRWPQAFAEIDALQPAHSEKPEFNYLLARLAAASGQQLDRGEAALLFFLSHPAPAGIATKAQAHALLGEIREKIGNRSGALAAYRAAVELDSNFLTARQGIERLQGAR